MSEICILVSVGQVAVQVHMCSYGSIIECIDLVALPSGVMAAGVVQIDR